jgi:metallo-beta-lactamase family protein
MIEGGRIEHHIYNNIENQYATILFIGYCAEETFGHELLQKPEYLRAQGKSLKVMADIRSTDIFSGHGDVHDLKKFVHQQETSTKVFLVHGDEGSMAAFQKELNNDGYQDVEMPYYEQEFEL